MSTPSDKRRPKAASSPSRQIRFGGNPDGQDVETIAWHFNRLDRPHECWGWDKLVPRQWKMILEHLRDFEGLTWAELKAQAGGRSQGTNHHSITIKDFTSDARKRLAEINLDDFDSLFSLRINNTLRLYGVRDGRVLQLVWHDPHHGSGKGACPTKKQKKKSSN